MEIQKYLIAPILSCLYARDTARDMNFYNETYLHEL